MAAKHYAKVLKTNQTKKADKKTVKKTKQSRYNSMIDSALVALHNRKGVSRQAIEKYIVSNYTIGSGFRARFKIALKKGVTSGDIIQTKGSGANGSFKRKITPSTTTGRTTGSTTGGTITVTAPKRRGTTSKAPTNTPKRRGRPKKTVAASTSVENTANTHVVNYENARRNARPIHRYTIYLE